MPPLTLPPRMHAGGLGWKILRWLADHPGPHHYTTMAKGMRHRRIQSVLNGCVKLAHQGHLRWVSPGVYRLAPETEHR